MNTKVAAPSGKPSIGRDIRQPRVGKLTADMNSMPGSKGKGQGVQTVKSNPVTGKNVQGNTSMGNGALKSGFV